MTDTPTHSEVIAACDVLTRVSYTPRVTKEQLQSVKAQAQNGLATERQDEEDCSLGRAVMDAYPDYLNGDYTMLGRAVRAAIEAVGARIVPADGQPDGTEAAAITWHLGPVQVRSSEAGDEQPVGELIGYARIKYQQYDDWHVLRTYIASYLDVALNECSAEQRVAALCLLPKAVSGE